MNKRNFSGLKAHLQQQQFFRHVFKLWDGTRWYTVIPAERPLPR